MPKPLSRRELNELDPWNPAHQRIIADHWRRRNAAKNRVRREVAGWVRVTAVIATYLVIAALVVAVVYLIAAILLALFA